MVHCQNNRARTKEEACFEKGMREQVISAGPVSTNANTDEHVTQLRDGGVGQHFLDVVLQASDGGGKQGRNRTHEGDDGHGQGAVHVQEAHARNHVDTGGNHRGRVNQGRHRRWASHGVGEPYVEGDLRRFAGGANEEEDAHQRKYRQAPKTLLVASSTSAGSSRNVRL